MAEDLTTKAPASAEAVGSGGRGPARQPRLHGEDDGPSAHSSSRIRGQFPASRSREAAGRTLGFCPETAARGCRSSWSFRDDSSRLKDSVLEYEREVIRGWFVPRIFTHRMRRWMLASSTRSIFAWM